MQALLDEHAGMALKPLDRNYLEFELTWLQKFKKQLYEFNNQKTLRKYRDDAYMAEELRYKATSWILTRRLDWEEAESALPQIPACPVICQEYVRKQFELRITIVGKEIFPCAIYSQEADAAHRVDWRGDPYAIRHEAFALPSDIEEKCLALMDALGLQFGCIDMIVTPDNEYVFLEINPWGQWLWVQQLTSMPITEALVDLLISREALSH